jgi:hypothetical protein
MRFGTWNVRSLYRAGSLETVARELASTVSFGCDRSVINDAEHEERLFY